MQLMTLCSLTRLHTTQNVCSEYSGLEAVIMATLPAEMQTKMAHFRQRLTLGAAAMSTWRKMKVRT